MARYRKIDYRTWNDEKFQSLPPLDKYVALYCLTAQCNRIGIFKFSIALGAEDTGLPIKEFRERFDRVCQTLNWPYDDPHRVLYFPTWWKYNNPGSPKTLKGLLEDAHEVPVTHLLQSFCVNNKYLSDTLSDTLSEFAAKGMAYQEQEIEQEQEQEIDIEPDGIEPDTLSENCDRFVRIWNSAPGVKTVARMSDGRRKHLNARAAEKIGELPWLDALESAIREKFPLKCTQGGDGWLPDGDWILKPDSLLKVVEGKYDWARGSPNGDHYGNLAVRDQLLAELEG